MASRLEVDGVYGRAWAGELGRQVVTGLLALAFLAALVVAVVATDGGAGSVTTGTSAMPETGALRIAVGDVLDAAGGGESVQADDAAAPAALEDAWETLAGVYGRIEAQLEVARGTRPPLMSAPPPAPGRAAREDALLRSAMTYVRGALETHDARSLERARDLLEMRAG